MFVVTSKNFKKKFKKLSAKEKNVTEERVSVFMKNPFDKRLNNHQLKGDKKNFRSINITGDLRLLFEEVDDDAIRFLDIDTHSNLYS